MRPRRVDAVAGRDEGVVRHDVRRRHAEFAAAAVALHDLALEQEGAAEEAARLVELACGHEAADVARADRLALDLHQRHDAGFELGSGTQEGRVASRLATETEVLTYRDVL